MAYIYEKGPPNVHFISGIWVDHSGIVSHYAVHDFLDPGASGARRLTKYQTIDLVDTEGRVVYVWGWDYKNGRFVQGKQVFCTHGQNGSYLHHKPFEDRTKNLKHLIKIDWFEPVSKK